MSVFGLEGYPLAGAILIAAACLISAVAILGMVLAWDRTPSRESHSELNHRIDAEAAAAAERYHSGQAWGR